MATKDQTWTLWFYVEVKLSLEAIPSLQDISLFAAPAKWYTQFYWDYLTGGEIIHSQA